MRDSIFFSNERTLELSQKQQLFDKESLKTFQQSNRQSAQRRAVKLINTEEDNFNG